MQDMAAAMRTDFDRARKKRWSDENSISVESDTPEPEDIDSNI